MGISITQKTTMIEMSVIIPTYNRVDRLQACLEALSHQTQPLSDFEVIVVVDGSNDGTVEMLESLSTPYTLIVLCQKNKGQHIARNNGVEHARGRYCLFLDDDIMADPQLIAEHTSLHKLQEGVVGIGQITIQFKNDDWFTKRFAEGWHEHYQDLNRIDIKPSWEDCYSGNMSVSRLAFNEVGGFAEDIPWSEDLELGYRLEQHGLRFIYLPEAIGRQDEHKKAREIFADFEKAGAALVSLCKRHPSMHAKLLGPLGQASMREALLRELIWRFNIPPSILAWLGGFFTNTFWAAKWYRFLFTFGYWRGVRRAIPDWDTWQQMVGGVPILMYHAFSEDGNQKSQYILPLRCFSQQMAWLKRLNYRVISLEEYLLYRTNYELLPARSVIITIDDGYKEIATLVSPILKRYGFPATIFIVTDKIGGCNDWTEHDGLQGRQLLTWKEIHQLAHQEIRFGAHTRTHPMLTNISVEDARDEIEGSKAQLESSLNQVISTFAYPFGEFNSTVEALVEQAGFMGGCSVEPGLNTSATPITALRRIEINRSYSLPQFLLCLRLGAH
jgi:glycosyltransferase involved in cell wall biosynthesis/peptidoglycan/xylan/chitin deacetylase (PgdA/CDA1 family)